MEGNVTITVEEFERLRELESSVEAITSTKEELEFLKDERKQIENAISRNRHIYVKEMPAHYMHGGIHKYFLCFDDVEELALESYFSNFYLYWKEISRRDRRLIMKEGRIPKELHAIIRKEKGDRE